MKITLVDAHLPLNATDHRMLETVLGAGENGYYNDNPTPSQLRSLNKLIALGFLYEDWVKLPDPECPGYFNNYLMYLLTWAGRGYTRVYLKRFASDAA